MRLRKSCEHGKYDAHYLARFPTAEAYGRCPGGVFLPDDALADALKEWDEIGREHPLDSDFYTAGAAFILETLFQESS